MSKKQRTPEEEEVDQLFDFKQKSEKWLGLFGIQVIRFRYVLLFLIVLGVGFLSTYIPRINIATSLESSFKGHNRAIQEYQKLINDAIPPLPVREADNMVEPVTPAVERQHLLHFQGPGVDDDEG